MRFIFILSMFFPPVVFAEYFSLICEERDEFRNLKAEEIYIIEFESVLIQIKKSQWNTLG